MGAEEQYLDLCKDLLDNGVWAENERTGKSCLTLPTRIFTYTEDMPILKSKYVHWKGAIAEMIGYLNGHTSAKDFRELGTKTWDMNANKTQAWLDNPVRKGEDDIGKVYGAVAKDFGGINLIDKVINNLQQGIDDRGEIITFWKPDDFDKACLRPCMHSHQFTLLDGVLYLSSTQRSCDVPLGLPYNMVQCWWLLKFMCDITGYKFGSVTHTINQPHIYEDQLKGVLTQLRRSKSEDFSRIKDNRIAITLPSYDYIGGIVEGYYREKGTCNVRSCSPEGELPLQGSMDTYQHMGSLPFPFSE